MDKGTAQLKFEETVWVGDHYQTLCPYRLTGPGLVLHKDKPIVLSKHVWSEVGHPAIFETYDYETAVTLTRLVRSSLSKDLVLQVGFWEEDAMWLGFAAEPPTDTREPLPNWCRAGLAMQGPTRSIWERLV